MDVRPASKKAAALTTERQARAHVEQKLLNVERRILELDKGWQTAENELAVEQSFRQKADAKLLASERAREEDMTRHKAERAEYLEQVRDAQNTEEALAAATRTGAQLRAYQEETERQMEQLRQLLQETPYVVGKRRRLVKVDDVAAIFKPKQP